MGIPCDGEGSELGFLWWVLGWCRDRNWGVLSVVDRVLAPWHDRSIVTRSPCSLLGASGGGRPASRRLTCGRRPARGWAARSRTRLWAAARAVGLRSACGWGLGLSGPAGSRVLSSSQKQVFAPGSSDERPREVSTEVSTEEVSTQEVSPEATTPPPKAGQPQDPEDGAPDELGWAELPLATNIPPRSRPRI